MSEKNQQSLSSLMKKQLKEDTKKNQAKKTATVAVAKSDKAEKVEGENPEIEEMSEEEKLEDAKKASVNKAAQYDHSGMIKKLILESIIKYTALMAVLVIFAFGIIKLGPAFIDMFSGLLSKILFGAIGTK